jgi:hypothetical protein
LYMMPSRKCKSGFLDKAYMIGLHKKCFYDWMNCNHFGINTWRDSSVLGSTIQPSSNVTMFCGDKGLMIKCT